MWYFTDIEFGIFVSCFIGFFIFGACVLKYVHERRLRARVQEELNTLFQDYIPLEGDDIETINFINDQSRRQAQAV